MAAVNKQLHRVVHLVAALKRGEYPNTASFASRLRTLDLDQNEDLAVSPKTVQRDIDYLRHSLDAPVVYDPGRRGYRLEDPSWEFPFLRLGGDELFATLFSSHLGETFLPPVLQDSLSSAQDVQLAAADPGNFSPELLGSVLHATASCVEPSDGVFNAVLRAWRSERRLAVDYRRASDERVLSRIVEPHALFLSDGAWYMRAYCHLRHDTRSLALHRCLHADLTDERFERSPGIVAEVRAGRIFDYDHVADVVVRCSAEKAAVLRERKWLPGQQCREETDGSLVLRYPAVPRQPLLWWVLSYAGHLVVGSPADLRHEIQVTAQALAEKHRATPSRASNGLARANKRPGHTGEKTSRENS